MVRESSFLFIKLNVKRFHFSLAAGAPCTMVMSKGGESVAAGNRYTNRLYAKIAERIRIYNTAYGPFHVYETSYESFAAYCSRFERRE